VRIADAVGNGNDTVAGDHHAAAVPKLVPIAAAVSRLCADREQRRQQPHRHGPATT